MKSFSFKALALAFVVAGSANADISEYVTSAKNGVVNCATSVKKSVVNAVNTVDAKLFGEFEPNINIFDNDDAGTVNGGLPILNSYLRPNSSRVRTAIIATVATAAVTAAVVKTYKHFTKPAVEATEGENVEANDANTEVVA